MNQSEPPIISPPQKGEFSNSRQDKEAPTLSLGRYALGWGPPLALAIFFLLLGFDAQPLDLLVRWLCVGLAALLGRQLMSAWTPVAQQPLHTSPSRDQLLTVHQALVNLQLPILLQQFVDEMVMLIPCRGALLILLDDRQEEPEYIVTNGSIPSSVAYEFSSLFPQELFLEALEKKSVVINTPQELQDRLGSFQEQTFVTHNLFIGSLRRRRHLAFLLFADRLEVEGFLPEDEQAFVAVEEAAMLAIENARQFTDLQEKEKDHRDFLRNLINMQEQDNKFIAEEWQDRVGHKLFKVLQGLLSFHSLVAQRAPEIGERFQEITATVDETAALVRSLTNELHPTVLDDFGVAAAIREYVADGVTNQEKEPLQVTVQADDVGQQLPSEAKLLLFRVTQEALRNIRQHAEARNVQIAFVQEHSGVSLMIKDDGKGFNSDLPHPEHFGLHYMKERAEAYGGTFRVISAQGQGTEVHLNLPSSANT